MTFFLFKFFIKTSCQNKSSREFPWIKLLWISPMLTPPRFPYHRQSSTPSSSVLLSMLTWLFNLQASLMRRVVSRSWPSTPTRCETSTCSIMMSTSQNWLLRPRTTAVPSLKVWSGLHSPPPWTDTSRSVGPCKYAKLALGKSDYIMYLQ